ncbi:MAG: tRNA-uridine 2-sulfurtransferase [Thermoleophilaceae bacterium]|nr:tRNA-uridine 2-sulfurtransferase [Thermoleophilaceae bacterium]
MDSAFDLSPLDDHLAAPRGRGRLSDSPHAGSFGGAPCGDEVRIAVRLEDDRVADAGFDASGCAAARAAGSAAVELVRGALLTEAALVSTETISAALGGLASGRIHAAALAADALHAAIGAAATDGAARLAPSARRTLVAMSGGVDSAVAAQLALDAGHEVLAVTLKLWDDAATDGTRSCCSPQAVAVARALAHRMGIPHITLDVRDGFRAEVVDDFIAEHAAGRTPNPCVRCNGIVRFDAMLALAESLGAARLATGHYARIAWDQRGPLVRAAVDARKDQSYMLARLPPDALRRIWFPLGEQENKASVRELARGHELPVADKPESQDLCFLAGTRAPDFLRRHGGIEDTPGAIVDEHGRAVGEHAGQHRFTVGQRRGIGVASTQPLYVVDKDPSLNRVTVGPKASLAQTEIRLEDVVLYRSAGDVDRVKLRYRSDPVPCDLRPATCDLSLGEPVAGAAPGQTACLMQDDTVIGCGTIAVPLRREVAHAG